MKKQITASILAAILALSLGACTNPGNTSTEPSTESATGDTTGKDLYDIEYDYKDYITTLGTYKGVEIEMHPEASQEEIEEYVAAELQEAEIFKKITDRAAKTGDTVSIEFKGYVDGEEDENCTSPEASEITLGAGGFIDGFEEGIIGNVPSESTPIELNLTFPEEYYDEYKGKAVTFKITLHYIREEYTIDELTDDMAKEFCGNCDTVTEFLAYAKQDIEEQKSEYQKENKANLLMAGVIDNSVFSSYPQELYDYYYNYFIDYYKMRYQYYESYLATYYGINNFTDYAKQTFGTLEAFYNYAETNAKSNSAFDLVCKAIIDKESITLTDEEYNEGIQKYLESEDFSDYETAEEFIEEFGEKQIRYTLINQKVLDLIESNSIEK